MYNTQYQLQLLDLVQRWFPEVVDDVKVTGHLKHCKYKERRWLFDVFYRLYNRKCSQELFDKVPQDSL